MTTNAPISSLPKQSTGSYFLVVIAAAFVTTAELLLKKGAVAAVGGPSFLGITALGSGWTWLGILSHLGGFAAWLMILRRMPLALAVSLMSVTQVLVPLAAWGLLGERLQTHQMLGILLVLAGIVTIARSFARAEEVL